MASKPPRKPSVFAAVGLTRQEQASAALSSVLLLLGVMTIGLFLAWLSATMVRDTPAAKMIPVDVGGGFDGDRLTGGDKDLDVPNPAEVRDGVVEEKVAPALESIAILASDRVLQMSDCGLSESDARKERRRGIGEIDGIPAWERWEIEFSACDINLYAQQLDFFQVELGVAGGGIEWVDYCSHLAAAKPNWRWAKPALEKRLFFLYKSGTLREADRTLARKAGIEVSDRVVFQFYTPEMYQRLLTLENERMGKRRISEVKRTTFGLRGTPGKWEFYVVDQQYRTLLPSQGKL